MRSRTSGTNRSEKPLSIDINNILAMSFASLKFGVKYKSPMLGCVRITGSLNTGRKLMPKMTIPLSAGINRNNK
jgi:hypothetical protein